MDREEAQRLFRLGQSGISEWNEWRRKNAQETLPDLSGSYFDGFDLSFVDFHAIDLHGATFKSADLHKADLRTANLRNADLTSANLSSSDLREAKLCNSRLSKANLTGVNLRFADLSYADICGARIAEADTYLTDFSHASVGFTIWSGLNLSQAKGLRDMSHVAESTIGIETLLKSEDLTDLFLLGCGVPETILEYVKALPHSLQPIQFYSCFISYSHQDEELAKRLHGRLRQEGLRIWYAPEDMKGGKKIYHQIDEAIRLLDKLLLVLSEASMSSEWVATEIYKARQREVKEGRQVLFPIRLVEFDRICDWECFDADTGKDMAREIREYFIPDFTEWKDYDRFEAAFARLLADLKKSTEPAAN